MELTHLSSLTLLSFLTLLARHVTLPPLLSWGVRTLWSLQFLPLPRPPRLTGKDIWPTRRGPVAANLFLLCSKLLRLTPDDSTQRDRWRTVHGTAGCCAPQACWDLKRLRFRAERTWLSWLRLFAVTLHTKSWPPLQFLLSFFYCMNKELQRNDKGKRQDFAGRCWQRTRLWQRHATSIPPHPWPPALNSKTQKKRAETEPDLLLLGVNSWPASFLSSKRAN